MEMKIEAPHLCVEGDNFVYRAEHSVSQGQPEQIWFRVDPRNSSLVSDRTDAALVALLIPAMTIGGTLRVDGPVSVELVHYLHQDVQEVLRCLIPSLKQVRLVTSEPVPSPNRGPGVASGFSGGVDSFALLHDHLYSTSAPPSLRLTHLLYNNVGSHGTRGRRLFNDRLNRVADFAVTTGLPLVAVDSNVDECFAATGLSFERTATIRNASVAYLLQEVIGRWLYASSYDFSMVKVAEMHDMGYIDPILVPLLATSAMQMRSVGSEYRRFDKTNIVASMPESYSYLDVCVQSSNGRNCSTCWKCLRELATFELLGVLDRYADVFDLEVYRQRRAEYLRGLRLSDRPNDVVLYREMGARGVPVPRPLPRQHARHLYRSLPNGSLRRLIADTGLRISRPRPGRKKTEPRPGDGG